LQLGDEHERQKSRLLEAEAEVVRAQQKLDVSFATLASLLRSRSLIEPKDQLPSQKRTPSSSLVAAVEVAEGR
jgi:hypothetical protein